MNFSTLKRRWRALIHKRAVEQELDNELQFHLDKDIAENIKSGMTAEDARFEALKAFGGVEQSKEEARDARGVRVIENVLEDARYSLRLLTKSPAFTFVVLLTLALGIGANTVIFSFANGILLRPLPYPQSDRLVVLDETSRKENGNVIGGAYPNFLDWRAQNTVFEGIATHFGTSRFAMSAGGSPSEIRGSRVTYGLFELLHVSPILGRTFTFEEDRPDDDAVVILGYDLWQRSFGGNRNVIGQKVLISSRPRTVVGVMPRGFRFPEVSELWVPLAVTDKIYTRNDHGLETIAR